MHRSVRGAARPAGTSHIGFETQNMKDTAEELKHRGIAVPEVSSVGCGAPHTSIMDPNGIRLEMLEFAEGSLQRKAIES